MGLTRQLSQNVTPGEARGLKSWEHGPNAISFGGTAVLTHKFLRAQHLDSSVAEFTLSNVDGLFRNDMSVSR